MTSQGQPPQQFPLMLLTCQPNSHPFQERSVTVLDTVKIGRSVARIRPAPNNAVFDCKVLSRNHAIIWFEDFKFWLKDTKSSNGTFVNNQRLSKGTEESPPRHIFSGDIIQFGVDVVENTTTHGCIVAQISLFHPDGTEAKRVDDQKLINGYSGFNEEQLYQLSQYIEEAMYREQGLDKKMELLQTLMDEMRTGFESCWKVLLNEDSLLQKVEYLNDQLHVFVETSPIDQTRVELLSSMDHQFHLESSAKEFLDKLVQEKYETVKKLLDLERLITEREAECGMLQSEVRQLKEECQQLSETNQRRLDQLDQSERRAEALLSDLDQSRVQQASLEDQVEGFANQTEELHIRVEKAEAERDSAEEQCTRLQVRVTETLDELQRRNSGPVLVDNSVLTDDLITLQSISQDTCDVATTAQQAESKPVIQTDTWTATEPASLLGDNGVVAGTQTESGSGGDDGFEVKAAQLSERLQAEHEATVRELRQRADVLAAEVFQLKKELSDMMQLVEKSRAEIETAKSRAIDAEAQAIASQQELEEVRLQQKATPAKSTTSADEEQQAVLSTVCTELRARIELIEKEMHAGRADYESLLSDYERTEAECKAAKMEEGNLSQQLFRSQLEVEELQGACRLLKDEVALVQERMTSEYRALAARTRLVSAAAVLPIMLLLFAAMMAIFNRLSGFAS